MTPHWERPRTTKVYLHPPLAERLCLACADMKLLDLTLLDNGTHVGQSGVGLLLLCGKDLQGFDLNKTVWRAVDGGIPIYEIRNRAAVAVALEAFCDTERNPTVYFRVTLTNDTNSIVSDTIGLLPRSGKDTYLLNQHQEGYSPYRPNFKNWYMLKRTWQSTASQTAVSDMGCLKLTAYEGVTVMWVDAPAHGHMFEAADYFKLDYTLKPGERAVIYGALRAGKDEISDFDYEEKKRESTVFWQAQLDQLKVIPKTADTQLQAVFRHMVTQCTQMLARYEGSDLVYTRQGDVGRFVWPYEGVQILTILDRLGLSEHTGAAYRCYCERWLVKDGEDCGKIGSHAGWENFTGSVIWGLSEHLKVTRDVEELAFFLPHLISMRDWIERKRQAPRNAGYHGIFPPGKGSDWSDVAQFWTFTDCHNAMGLRSMYEMLEQYESVEAAPTRAIYEDYRDALIRIRDELYRGHEDDQTYIFPHELGVAFEDSENYSYYTDGAPYMLYTGFMEPDSRMRRQMENFFRSRGQFEKGLTGRMTSCNSYCDEAFFGGYGDVWYTMQSEICWIRAWVASGEFEKAKETLDAVLTYGMTSEYIVAERYCSIEPWYAPWQPNGSGSARMIEMLLTYFGESSI